MSNPIHIDALYQDVKEALNHQSSVRHSYALLLEFLEALEGEYEKYESYIEQLIQKLPNFFGILTWCGLKPDDVESLIGTFNSLKFYCSHFAQHRQLKTIIIRLRSVAFLLYVCLNEIEKAEEHFETVTGETLNILDLQVVKSTDANSLKMLRSKLSSMLEQGFEENSEAHSFVVQINNDLKQIINKSEDIVCVPVVETQTLLDSSSAVYGRIRRLNIDVIGEGEQEDVLRNNYKIHGAERSVSDEFIHCTKAARITLESIGNYEQKKNFKGIVNYELTGAIHHGDSANLAIAALWYSSLTKQAGKREHVSINPFAAITGQISEDGLVKPVKTETIPVKAEASFYSWCRVLVVPDSQKKMFEGEIKKLQNKHPHKTLEVVGANKLEDLLYDRRVTNYERQTLAAYYSGWLWKHKSHYLTWGTIVVLTGVIFSLIYGPLDKNPASFNFQGEYLILSNTNGTEVKRIPVDRETVDYQNTGNNLTSNPLVVLFDVNGDGMNDVIWASRGDWRSEETSRIQAYSTTGDSIIWQREFKMEYTFPRQSAYLQTGLRTNKIGIIEFDHEDVRIITLNGSGIYFTAAVHSLDIFTGEIISDYLHIGALTDMFFMDLTGNGAEEIILAGVNNAYWNAAVIVLDPLNLRGHSPLTPDYKPEGLEKAEELHYILIPKTEIGEYVSPIERFNFARQLHYDEVSERVWARIQESSRVFRDNEMTAEILVYFDHEMRPAGVGTNDLYDIIARELYEEGAIPTLPDYDYFELFQDSILYWDGEGFKLLHEFDIN